MDPWDGQEDESGSDMITMNPPRWQRWRPARPIAFAGVALAALAGGAGVGWAAIHSPSAVRSSHTAVAVSSPSPAPKPVPVPYGGGREVFGGGIPGGPARFARGPLGAGLIHGQFTVPESGGGYQTILVQSGTVTAVSASSVTVKSSDGYTLSYAVTSKTVVDAQSAGIGSVKKGDTVFVTATVSGTTATAVSVLDATAVKSGRASFGFPAPPAKLRTPPALPAPSAQPANA
jgi:hypothetical protein